MQIQKQPRRNPRGGKEINPSSDSQASRQYDADQLEFLMAIDAYKRRTGRFVNLAWTEVLDILKSLGYAKPSPTAQPSSPTP